MDYKDVRATVVWEVGDLVVTATTQRYWIIQEGLVADGASGQVSLVNTVTSRTAMTRPTIAELQVAFQSLFTVQEIIKASDLMITATND